MPAKRDLEREQKVVGAYLRGVEPAIIAERYGVSRPYIYHALERSGHEARRGYPSRPGKTPPGQRNKDLPPERYENRDPCFYCGATGMAGCKHRRAGWA